MDNLDMIDNRLNNATCPKLIESLIYQRKGAEIEYPVIIEQLRQEELKLNAQKESLLDKLKMWFQYE